MHLVLGFYFLQRFTYKVGVSALTFFVVADTSISQRLYIIQNAHQKRWAFVPIKVSILFQSVIFNSKRMPFLNKTLVIDFFSMLLRHFNILGH